MAKDKDKDKKSPPASRPPARPKVIAMEPPPTPPSAPEAPLASVASVKAPSDAPVEAPAPFNPEEDFEGEEGALRLAKKALERQVAREAEEAAARKANGL